MEHGAALYRRFLDGDETAFDDILKEYRGGLTFFINGYVHDAATAEDIAIDVFTQLLLHKNRYNFKTSLKTYLYMMGRSRALDVCKHRKKLTVTPLDDAVSLADSAADPNAQLLQDERKRVLHTALDRLSPTLREAVQLVYFEELSYQEAAQVMKKTVKQVDNLLYRAKKELRDILGTEGVDLL